jgi:hypothetical protein
MGEYVGGQYIYQGLSNFGEQIGAALEQRQQQGKYAKSLRQLLSVVDPDKAGIFETMDLPKLEGELQGRVLKRTIDRYKAEEAAQAQALAAHKYQLEQQRTSDQAFGNAMRMFAKPPAEMAADVMPQGLRPEITPGERFMGAIGTPGLDEKGVSTLGTMFDRYEQGTTRYQPQAWPIPGTGSSLVTFGKQSYPVPNAPDPNGQIPTRTLPGGQIAMFNGKSWVPVKTDTASTQRHEYVRSLIDSEKALSGIDEKISDWKMQERSAKTKKSIPKPDPAALDELMARRTRLTKMLNSFDTTNAAPAAVGTNDAGTVGQTMGLPNGSGMRVAPTNAAAANAVQEPGGTPKMVRQGNNIFQVWPDGRSVFVREVQ